MLLFVNFQRLPYQVQKRCMLNPILSIIFFRLRYYILMIFSSIMDVYYYILGQCRSVPLRPFTRNCKTSPFNNEDVKDCIWTSKTIWYQSENYQYLLRYFHYCNYLSLQPIKRSLVLILSRKLRSGFLDQQRRKQLQNILIIVILTQACKKQLVDCWNNDFQQLNYFLRHMCQECFL